MGNSPALTAPRLTSMPSTSSAICYDVSRDPASISCAAVLTSADTGDRPYMCVLCRDTFSRSDILKRHFQKCSIRRGNPTGASHLSHPQAHVKKNAQAQKAAGLNNEGDINHLNGLNNMPGDGMVHPFGMVPVSDGMNMSGDQNQLSRSSSMNRMENGGNQDRRNMPAMGASQPYGSDVANSMHNQQMPGYSMPPGQNGMPMYAASNPSQQSGLDWSQMFQPGGEYQSRLRSRSATNPLNHVQDQTGTKIDPDCSCGDDGSPAPRSRGLLLWGRQLNTENPQARLLRWMLNFPNLVYLVDLHATCGLGPAAIVSQERSRAPHAVVTLCFSKRNGTSPCGIASYLLATRLATRWQPHLNGDADTLQVARQARKIRLPGETAIA